MRLSSLKFLFFVCVCVPEARIKYVPIKSGVKKRKYDYKTQIAKVPMHLSCRRNASCVSRKYIFIGLCRSRNARAKRKMVFIKNFAPLASSSVWHTPMCEFLCLLFRHIFKQVFLQSETSFQSKNPLNALCKVEILKL